MVDMTASLQSHLIVQSQLIAQSQMAAQSKLIAQGKTTAIPQRACGLSRVLLGLLLICP
jgi:hypothetical protein